MRHPVASHQQGLGVRALADSPIESFQGDPVAHLPQAPALPGDRGRQPDVEILAVLPPFDPGIAALAALVYRKPAGERPGRIPRQFDFPESLDRLVADHGGAPRDRRAGDNDQRE